MSEKPKTMSEAVAEYAEDFAVVFDPADVRAKRVMEVLGSRFGYVNQPLYDRNSKDPSGEALVRAGHLEVLQFIGAMIAKGNEK